MESTLGKGTHFNFRIAVEVLETPLETPGTSDQAKVSGLQAGQQAWRILVADDDEDNRLLLKNLLRQAGFEVEEADNGAQAVERFQIWQPHFIWMDIRMPVMDGCIAAKKIRSLPGGEQVKIVAVTANVFQEDRAKIFAAGCDDIIGKPFRTPEVFQIMEKHLRVRYVYTQGSAQPFTAPPQALCTDNLKKLPQDLLNELLQAALHLDMEQLERITARVRDWDPSMAASIEALTQKFNYKRLCDLCEQVLEDEGKQHE